MITHIFFKSRSICRDVYYYFLSRRNRKLMMDYALKIGSFDRKYNNKIVTNRRSDDFVNHILIKWSTEDIQNVRPDLSDEQASDVLVRLKKNHNAEIGINWDTIEVTADILFPQNEETMEEMEVIHVAI